MIIDNRWRKYKTKQTMLVQQQGCFDVFLRVVLLRIEFKENNT